MRKIVAVLAAALGLGLSPAAAAVMQATFSGHTTQMLDGLGLFGPSGVHTPGEAATMTFLFDTQLGAPAPSFLSFRDGRRGGTGSGTTSPITSASVTIGGVTVFAGIQFESTLGLMDSPFTGQGFHVAGDSHAPWSTSNTGLMASFIVNFWAANVPIPATLDVPFTVSNIASLGGSQFSGFLFRQCAGPFGSCGGTDLYLWLDSLTVSAVPAAVPLPAGGLLLLGGLSALGVARRRRVA